MSRAVAIFSAILLPGCVASGSASIPIVGANVFPESVTATARGDLIIGGAGNGALYRAAPGESKARLWRTSIQTNAPSILGVLADDRAGILWACSHAPKGMAGAPADRAAALLALSLRTGAPIARYPMPGGAAALCNDIAADGQGGAFVTDTRGGRVLRLSRGSLSPWAAGPLLTGADGIALDGRNVIVTSVSTGKLLSIPILKDGFAGPIHELALSMPLQRPDGLRAIGRHRLLLADWSLGQVFIASIADNRATLRSLGGLRGTTTAAWARGRVWAADAKLAYLQDLSLQLADPGSFQLYSLRR